MLRGNDDSSPARGPAGEAYGRPNQAGEPGSVSHGSGGVDLVLIYPPWTLLEERGYLMSSLPPLGLLSIAAYVRSKGLSVAFIDVHAERLGPAELRERLRRLAPRHAGITVLSPLEGAALTVARLVKEEVPGCVVVTGGVHAEAFPRRILRSPHVDLVVRGDGEPPMAAIAAGLPWEDIESVSYRREDGTIHHTKAAPLETRLDAYPIPAYDLVDLKHYAPSASSYEKLPAANVMMTRGCPGACTFCNSARTPLRSHSPRRVLETIELLKRLHGIRQVQFFDDTFTARRKNVLELCRLLREHRTKVSFSCYARGDTFGREMARALRSAGCHQVMLGIESGSERMMRGMGKHISKDRYREMVRVAHDSGLEVRAGFILGGMGETRESMEESLRFAMELDVDFLQLSISTPYPGTMLFRQALAEGRLEHLDLRRYGQGAPIVRLDELAGEEIEEFERRAWRTFYLRPRVLARQLRRVTGKHHLLDLAAAFRLLILGRAPGRPGRLHEWEREMSLEAPLLDERGFEGDGDEDHARAAAPLTHEVRRSG